MRRSGKRLLARCSLVLLVPMVDASYAANMDVLGQVDGLAMDSSGTTVVRGWACWRGWSGSAPDVDLYVGGRAGEGGVRIGSFPTNQASEPAIAAACQATGRAYRFTLPLTVATQQNHGGKAIHIYGLAYPGPGTGPTALLNGSGAYTVPKLLPIQSSLTYVHTDRLGSSVMLTDEKANIVAKTNYKAYGGPTQNEQKPEAPGYTGHYEDPLTGLTYMQARYYDADLGVFLSIDPMPTTPGNLFNFGRYGYANANPLSFVDPDGRVAMAAVWLENISISAGGGGAGGGFFFRPPSNWWYDIERPNIGDYPGLIGGGGGRPNKPTNLDAVKVTADIPAIARLNNHYYFVENRICNSFQPSCDISSIFHTLRSYPAPFSDPRNMVNSGDLDYVPILGPVQHQVDEATFTVSNITLPGHLLHPGVVQRKVTMKNEGIYIQTIGVGSGRMGSLNERLSGPLWMVVDQNISSPFSPQMRW
jgi:RHS repeat-associated protein